MPGRSEQVERRGDHLGPGRAPAVRHRPVLYIDWSRCQLHLPRRLRRFRAASAFLVAEWIERLLGSTGVNVLSRILGILLAAVSAEMILAGLEQSGVFVR